MEKVAHFKDSNRGRATSQSAHRWLSITAIIIFAICGVLTFFIATTPSSNPLDYPFNVITTGRVLEGQKPYVDFALVYGPLTPYLNAVGMLPFLFLPLVPAYNLFYAACIMAYLAFLLWMLLRLLPGHVIPFAALTIYTALFLPIFAHYAYYSFLPVAMLIAAMYLSRRVFAVHLTIRQKAPALALMSLLAVAAFFTRINTGAYIFLGLGVVGLCTLISQRGRNWREPATLAAGTMLSAAVTMGILSCLGILGPYVQDMILFLPRYKARQLPLPYNSIELILVTLLVVLLLLLLIDLARRHRFGAGILSIVISICSYQYTLQRFDIEHLYSLFPLLPFVCWHIKTDYEDKPGTFSFYAGKKHLETWTAPALWIERLSWGVMLLIAISCVSLSSQILRESAYYWTYCFELGHSFTDDTVIILRKEAEMLQDLGSDPDGNSEIFWGSLPGCCESSTQAGPNLGLYLAQKRLPTAKYWYFDPCSTAHDDVQQAMVDDLEKRKFNRIAMQGLIDPTIGYLPGNPPESRIFYNYVLSKYSPGKRYVMPEANRYYDIYVRKASP